MTNSETIKIGRCQNLIRGQREDWADARYCGAATIDLGVPSERNVCQTCRSRSKASTAALIESWVSATLGDVGWCETAEAIIAEMDALVVRMLAARSPLSKIRAVQRDRDRRVALYEAVTA